LYFFFFFFFFFFKSSIYNAGLYRSPRAYVQANTVLYGCVSPDPPPNEAMQVEGEIAAPITPDKAGRQTQSVEQIVEPDNQRAGASVVPQCTLPEQGWMVLLHRKPPIPKVGR
jgi:hypothetical protein